MKKYLFAIPLLLSLVGCKDDNVTKLKKSLADNGLKVTVAEVFENRPLCSSSKWEEEVNNGVNIIYYTCVLKESEKYKLYHEEKQEDAEARVRKNLMAMIAKVNTWETLSLEDRLTFLSSTEGELSVREMLETYQPEASNDETTQELYRENPFGLGYDLVVHVTKNNREKDVLRVKNTLAKSLVKYKPAGFEGEVGEIDALIKFIAERELATAKNKYPVKREEVVSWAWDKFEGKYSFDAAGVISSYKEKEKEIEPYPDGIKRIIDASRYNVGNVDLYLEEDKN